MARRPWHLFLGATLVGCAVAVLHGPPAWRALGSVVATTLALHASLALTVHVAVAVGLAGLLLAAPRSHARGHGKGGEAPGATLHSPRFYDWLTAAWCLGREGRMRERTLDLVGAAAGEHVLDVGCVTGTLALAAKRRVGGSGTVHGVDASEEMIARARKKAARSGLWVAFEVATAQALPFRDATFDVVPCTLALHHLPEPARPAAVAEMGRVLRPGGRILIVELGEARGAWAVLHPVALLHARKARRILDEAVALLERAGLGRLVTGQLGFGGLGYALATRR
jgi:ubiquinone/menaquinone biosynthesis C-methylase UbiE